jgi:UDP-glucose 4-epimerase
MNYRKLFSGKVILITGGTGSFGHAVVDVLLIYPVKRIIIFSRDEKKQYDMRLEYAGKPIEYVIGDVRDAERVSSVMEGVDYVFHAAALKQVPTCEFFPIEAVKTNILGAHNVLRAAIENRVAKVVVLSTDKAVYPINAMGMSKALMEKTMIASALDLIEKGNKHSRVCGVRYGNVLFSRGSVLPYFVELIKKRKPLQMTNKDMTRFLLPLPKAVDLVLYALANGESGDMYVRKAPASTVETLGKAISELLHTQYRVKNIGIRAGEKMHETLVTAEELLRSDEYRDYYCIHPEGNGYDYRKFFERGKLSKRRVLPYTSENTQRLTIKETKKILLSLPEIRRELKESL